jgi:transposase-like protein
VQARLEDEAQCPLVIIGATPEGKKELVGLIDGVRESAQSWRELLQRLALPVGHAIFCSQFFSCFTDEIGRFPPRCVTR